MKKLLLIYLVLLATGCKQPEEPKFVTVEDLEIINLTGEEVALKGTAIFENPNNFSLTVKEIDIAVSVDEKPMGMVNQNLEIKVPANEKFEVPLTVNFSPDEIFDDLLSGVLKLLGDKKIDVHYLGYVKIKAAGFNFKIPIDHTEKVSIRK